MGYNFVTYILYILYNTITLELKSEERVAREKARKGENKD